MTCATCKKSFHLACIASTSSSPAVDWKCPLCRGKAKGGNNDNTPLRATARAHKRAALHSPKLDTEAILTRDDVRDVVQDIFTNQMENMFTRLGEHIRISITAALAPITQDIMDLQQSLANVNEDVSRSHNEMTEAVKKLQLENEAICALNKNLSARLEHVERNSLIRQNLPTEQNEDSKNKMQDAKVNKTIDDAINELQERSRREKSIIITGIPEAQTKNRTERREHDLNEAANIIQSLYNDCKSPLGVMRLGKYAANKNRHLKVFLESSASAKKILKNRNSIVGDYKIFSDQTETQKKYLNELRTELSQRLQNGENDLIIKYIKGTPKIIKDLSKNDNPSASQIN